LIKGREIWTEPHLVAANQINPALDELRWKQVGPGGRRVRRPKRRLQ